MENESSVVGFDDRANGPQATIETLCPPIGTPTIQEAIGDWDAATTFLELAWPDEGSLSWSDDKEVAFSVAPSYRPVPLETLRVSPQAQAVSVGCPCIVFLIAGKERKTHKKPVFATASYAGFGIVKHCSTSWARIAAACCVSFDSDVPVHCWFNHQNTATAAYNSAFNTVIQVRWTMNCGAATVASVNMARPTDLPFRLLAKVLREDEIASIVQQSVEAHPPTPEQKEVMEWFGATYWPVVTGTVDASCHCTAFEEESNDLGQEAWIRITRALLASGFNPERGTLGQWITGVASRTVAHVKDRRLRVDARHYEDIEDYEDRLVSSSLSPEEAHIWLELRERSEALLRNLSDQLPPESREVFCRHYVDGQSVKEISDATGLTSRAVESRCWRALEKCRALLAESKLNDWQ